MLFRSTALAQGHLRKAQSSQKAWYDRKARTREFEPGQEVLLLLPTSESKLLAKWHGPYKITRKVGPVTYELFMPERSKKHQKFHVNLLKEFCRGTVTMQQLMVRAVREEELPEQYFPTQPAGQPVDLSHLSSEKQEQVMNFLDQTLFTEKPGCTTMVQHKIHLKENTPARQKCYRVPERLLPEIGRAHV